MYILNLAIFQTFACTTIYGTATNRVQRSIQNAPGFPFRLIQDPLSLAFIAYDPSMLTPLYYREAASLRNTHGCTSMRDMCFKDVQTKQSYTTTYNKRSFFFFIVAVNQYKQAPINNILQKKTFAILAVWCYRFLVHVGLQYIKKSFCKMYRYKAHSLLFKFNHVT